MFGFQQLLLWHASGPVMIFCKDKAEAQSMAGHLGCACITSEVEERTRHEILFDWLPCSAAERENSKHILVGTSATSTSINPQHVGLVVHCRDAWDLVSYVQESGCAGYGSKETAAVFLAVECPRQEEMAKWYVEEQTCYHLVLSHFIDG
ncbi:uncharacterized protein MEPE_06867 [Melanopsichium pennsylvanicum]|uniref:Helicase C-terminal domain-containing protein n=2 Tax=Melanopsichium pennsylvanicum TaxID=63383 RepID=A0AAJ5C8N2_9BASI|nr:related to ATP-dependent DNA helicase RecQ [Melanopsichium pennsylvanicum 4]SNX88156.1 uncharacterized protein MEPE_06867 [Melanopsichium pennsylvanicum]